MAELEQFQPGESIYDSAFREKLNNLVGAVNETRGEDGVADPENTETRAFVGIPVELTARTAQGAGTFQFKEKIWNSGTSQWDDKTNGLTHTELGACRAIGGPPTAPAAAAHIGDVVYIYPKCIPSTNNVVYEFHVAPKLFPVNLTQLSGSDGTYNDDAPTYTYNALDKDGNTIATGLTPEIGRDKAPVVATATRGLAYIDTDGTWKLAWCNEVCDHSRGYFQVEGGGSDATATQAGGSDEEIEEENGKLLFCAPGGGTGDNGNQIPVYTAIVADDPAAGTDKVVQWIDDYDLPTGGTDLDGLVIWDKRIEVDDTTSTGVYTLDATDYRGRVIWFSSVGSKDDTESGWEGLDPHILTPQWDSVWLPLNNTTDKTLDSYASGFSIFIDMTDGHLKIDVTNQPASGKVHMARVTILRFEQKTTEDITINSTGVTHN